MRSSWHTTSLQQKMANITAAHARWVREREYQHKKSRARPVHFLPLADAPIGRMDSGQADWDLPEHLWEEMGTGFLRGAGGGPAKLFSWKNGLFVVSKERIRRHPLAVYESALRYVQQFGDVSHGLADVGGSFERLWQDIFGNCGFDWTGCTACSEDCGPCATEGGGTIDCETARASEVAECHGETCLIS